MIPPPDTAVTTVEGLFYLDRAPIAIEIAEGRIQRIVRKERLSDPSLATTFIAPGLIDHQVNGYLSHSFSEKGLTKEQVIKITKAFWAQGITTYLPTITTQESELIRQNFGILKTAADDPATKGSIPGFHLEGPYISPLDGFRGVHPKEWIRPPDVAEFSRWYEASGKKILEITVAPELDQALPFIEFCRTLGIVVALGHHNGSASLVKRAADAGASVSTHLGNGCANMIHRHDNPIWPQLADDRIAASIIVDGFHLRPEEVQSFYKVKGPDHTILVSDLSPLAGMPPGIYESFGTQVEMTPDGKITMPSQDVLAAASFLITKGIENVISYTHCSLAEAVHMASRNPAKLLGLTDRGLIEPGKRADLFLFTIQDGKLTVQKTLVKGELVYDAVEKSK